MLLNHKQQHIVSEILHNEINTTGKGFPVIIYKSLFDEDISSATFVFNFKKNGWEDTEVVTSLNRSLRYQNAHEVIGVFKGTVKISLIGDRVIVKKLNTGDIIAIPSGVEYKIHETSSNDVGFVRSVQLDGTQSNMFSGNAAIDMDTTHNVVLDPIFAEEGPLVHLWSQERIPAFV